MKYTDITLAHHIYTIHPADRVIVEHSISAIIFIPRYIGPKEKLNLEESTIRIEMRNGTNGHCFALDKTGKIIDEETIYFADRQEAEEELIIIKTKDGRKRNLGMQDLLEEGERG